MYTYAEAQKIVNYYAEKVISKPLNKAKAQSLPISRLKIEELEDHSFNVFCYAVPQQGFVFFTTVDNVAKDLGLMAPDEVLGL